MSVTKYPGEAFNILAVVVGEDFGTVTGSEVQLLVHTRALSI